MRKETIWLSLARFFAQLIWGIVIGIGVIIAAPFVSIYFSCIFFYNKLKDVGEGWAPTVWVGAWIAPLVVIAVFVWWPSPKAVHHAVRKPAATSTVKAPSAAPAPKPAVKPVDGLVWPEEVKGAVIVPKMPLAATGSGALTGWTIVIDPGHGGTDPGSGWIDNIAWKKYRIQCWEACYTYPAAWELSNRCRALGARVVLTTYSKTMEAQPLPPYLPYPLPRDAVYTDNKSSVNASRLGSRVRIANAWKGKKTVFVSLHTDKSLNEGMRGGHVKLDRRTTAITAIARLIADEFGRKYIRKNGKGKIIRPIDLKGGNMVTNPNKNLITEKALVELATPSNDHDGWMVRSFEDRSKLLDIVEKGLTDLAKEVK